MTSLHELYRSWKNGTITAAEKDALLNELALPENEEASVTILREMLEEAEMAENEPVIPHDRLELISNSITATTAQMPRVHWLRKWGWAAAVTVFLLAGAGFYYMSQRPAQQPVTMAIAEATPGSNKAVLTLADGRTITLDSTGNQVIQQGGTAVRQNGGQLQYDVQGGSAPVSYNILATPRGGQFQIKLPDGTKVWLNAASTIRYPTAFEGKERKVQITGEAYFEVVSNPQMPFKVDVNGQAEIAVLGTHFNINAYRDESSINAVLLEGAISVKKGIDNAVLQPGQQARIDNKAGVTVIKDADIAKAVAWKDGLFNFDGESLEEAMRQIARWYDVEVVYEKGIPNIEFVGKMSRQEKLSNLLKGFQGFGVHFRMENNRRIIVTP